MRRHYLVAYDVADDKRRNNIFRTLGDYGNHVQFSVFLCDLNERELLRLKALLREHTHDTEDQILILDLGKSVHPLDDIAECLGRGLSVSSRATVV